MAERCKRRLKSWDAGGGGTNLGSFGGAAGAQALNEALAERHQTCIQIAPHKENQKRYGNVVFVLDGVENRGGEINSEEHFGVRNPTRALPVLALEPRATLVAFDAVFGSAHEFGLLSRKSFDNGNGVAHRDAD